MTNRKKIRKLKKEWTAETDPNWIHTITDEVLNATITDPEVLKELKKICKAEILEQIKEKPKNCLYNPLTDGAKELSNWITEEINKEVAEVIRLAEETR